MPGLVSRLSQRQSQRTSLTLVQRQSVELLQLTAAELLAAVEETLAANPLLEAAAVEEDAGFEGTQTAAPKPQDAGDSEDFSGDSEPTNAAGSVPRPGALGNEEEAGVADDVESSAGAALGAPPAPPAADISAFDASEATAAYNFERSSDPAVISWQKTVSEHDEEERDPYEKIGQPRTLAQHLMEQLGCVHASRTVRLLTEWLIGSLDENGLLSEPVPEVFAPCPVPGTESEQRAALKLLQSFDPAGVGAESLTESLILQLSRKKTDTLQARQKDSGEAASSSKGSIDASVSLFETAARLLLHCSEELMRRDFRAASKILGVKPALVEEAFHLIATLDPHPASAFADTEASGFVVPEILVVREESPGGAADEPAAEAASGLRWVAKLNPAIVPRLTFDHASFALLTQSKLARDERVRWSKLAADARNFVHALEFRYSTITAVAQTIVNMQSDFFTKGPAAVKPMHLKDVARMLAMSESTISRATAGKYMQTPLGTFELKYFFGTGYTAEDGQEVSSIAVRRRIRELVAAEDPARPLSDNAIAEALASEGIAVARRTVAKYRELEHIAPKSLRRTEKA